MKSKALEDELQEILDYWATEVFDEEGKIFIGRVDGRGRKDAQAPLGLVLYARILWSFSAGYKETGKALYKERADRCYALLKDYFYDAEYGGFYWSVQADGEPLSQRKQIYGQAFTLYGLLEYYKICGQDHILAEAWQVFHLVEKFSFDSERGGYLEAFDRNWSPIDDMRLSQKDMNAAKTMNTHLHVLEAYSSLFKVSRDARVARQIKALLNVFARRITDPEKKNLRLFFTREWEPMAGIQSFGHDIEACWLLLEAIDTVYVGEEAPSELTALCFGLAEAAQRGILSDGSMANESVWGEMNRERHWWVQVEASVGFRHVARRTNNDACRAISDRLWDYIVDEIRDPYQGEWFWGRDQEGEVLWQEDKAGFWKGPYHNTRACLELLKLLRMEEGAQ